MLKIDHEASGEAGKRRSRPASQEVMAAQRGKPSGLHQGSSEANTMLKEEPTGFAKALDANVRERMSQE